MTTTSSEQQAPREEGPLLSKLLHDALHPNGPSTHAWKPGQRGLNPVLECTRPGCRVVWWPDRREPRSQCKGATKGGDPS